MVKSIFNLLACFMLAFTSIMTVGAFVFERPACAAINMYAFNPQEIKIILKVEISERQMKGMERFFDILVENKDVLYLKGVLTSNTPSLYNKLKRSNPEVEKYFLRAKMHAKRGKLSGSSMITPFYLNAVIKHLLRQMEKRTKKRR